MVYLYSISTQYQPVAELVAVLLRHCCSVVERKGDILAAGYSTEVEVVLGHTAAVGVGTDTAVDKPSLNELL